MNRRNLGSDNRRPTLGYQRGGIFRLSCMGNSPGDATNSSGSGKSGSGNMKAAFQCVGWKKKGSCFHELRGRSKGSDLKGVLPKGFVRRH